MSGNGSNLIGIVSASHAETADTALVATNGFSNALTVGTGVDLSGGAVNFNGSSARTLTLDLTEVITDDGANRILTSDGDGTLTAESTFLVDGGDVTLNGSLSASSFLQTATLRGDQNLSTGLQVDGYVLAQSVTSSGNISSSDDITANRFFADGAQDKGHISVNSTNTHLGTNLGWTVGTNITASGNISASGHLNIAGITSSGDVHVDQYIYHDGDLTNYHRFLSNRQIFVVGNASSIDLNNGVSSFGSSNGATTLQGSTLTLTGNITASGHISASGDLTVDNINGTIDGGSF